MVTSKANILLLVFLCGQQVFGQICEHEDVCVWKCYDDTCEGDLQTTSSGKLCRSWTSGDTNDANLDTAENFCRCFNGKAMPWCYTFSGQWEYCVKKAPIRTKSKCDDDFVPLLGDCFSVVPMKTNTYASAEEACTQRQSYLLSTINLSTFGALLNMSCRSLLLGFKLVNNTLVSSNGMETFVSRRVWCGGHPNIPPEWTACVALSDQDCLMSVECIHFDRNYHAVCHYNSSTNSTRPNASSSTEPSEHVTVYVSAFKDQTESNARIFYAYSLLEDQTEKEFMLDDAPWRQTGYMEGDLRNIVLMSKPVPQKFESSVYFCKTKSRTNKLKNSIQTWRHLISPYRCQPPWELNFKLYGAIESNDTEDNIRYFVGNQEDPDYRKYLHSRVSFETYKHSRFSAIQSFNLTGPSVTHNLMANKTVDNCQRVEKLRGKRGIITSPHYPMHYPRETDLRCSWRIVGDKNELIKLQFVDMRLNPHSVKPPEFRVTLPSKNDIFRVTYGPVFNHNQDCDVDRLEITDPSGRKQYDTYINYGTFCGNKEPDEFLSVNCSVALKFFGNPTSFGHGFKLRYEIISPPRNMMVLSVERKDRPKLTWYGAKQRCDENGKTLCSFDDICKYKRPFFKVERGNKWTPIMNEVNDWVQIGEENGQTCHRHNELYGPPLWGMSEGGCTGSDSLDPCSQNELIYCCDPPEYQQSTPASKLISIDVLTTEQNGNVYYKYVRRVRDTEDVDADIWSDTTRGIADVSTFKLYSHSHGKFQKPLYFCYKTIDPAIGQMATVYRVSNRPCQIDKWRLKFYLYGSDDDRNPKTKELYVGISPMKPFHSRIKFKSFPLNYRSNYNFVFFTFSANLIPDNDEVYDSSKSQTCSNTSNILNAPSIIESPGYPQQYPEKSKCIWTFVMTPADRAAGSRLQLIIVDFLTESFLDILYVYDLVGVEALDAENLPITNRTKYTGQQTGVIQITQGIFHLAFTSDASVNKRGFRIEVQVLRDSCGSNVTKHGTTISSPNFPSPYNVGTNCSWVIQSPSPKHGIEIQFGKFEIKNSTNCSEDKLSIRENGNVLKEYCGIHSKPKRFQMNKNKLEVIFESNNSSEQNTLRGFTFTVYFFFMQSNDSVRLGRNCGKQMILPWPTGQNSGASDRIIGGREAVVGSWPWMARIKGASCGGVIISTRWIMTASHCFGVLDKLTKKFEIAKPLEDYTIILGRHNKDVAFHEEQIYDVEKVVLHPGYARSKKGNGASGRGDIPVNDIALVMVTLHIRYSDYVQPICLPTQDAQVGENCVIAGWGAQGLLSTQTPGVLQYAHVPILENSLCNSWPEIRGSVFDNTLCAGYPGGGVDSCWGDSGGPLVCTDGISGSYQLKGIVSWGKACGKEQQPGIYTRVWSHMDWVNATLSN